MKKFLILCFMFLSTSLIAQETKKLKVVVSFSILADFAKIIGGDEIDLASIVPLNSDPHVYQPSPDIAALITQADLIIINGLEFEGWMTRLLEATKFQGKVVIVSNGVIPRVLYNPTLPSALPVSDPHAWHDVHQAMIYVKNISMALAQGDPAHAALYHQRTQDYLKKLEHLDFWIINTFREIPGEQQKIISAHDAFGYFAARYGLKMYALQGISTESEPSAKQVADLINLIKQEQIKALFVENMTSHRLLQQVADETHIDIGGTLYTDSLSDDKGPAKTYFDMMTHNVSTIVKAIQN
ncbi:MAG: metal ABC transporter solute-binding protein, Zn/Mn family [Janthinobacterium lividum]